MDRNRIITSLHDFIFSVGCISVIAFGLYVTGYIGGIITWQGSNTERTALANYEYAGEIDKKGNLVRQR